MVGWDGLALRLQMRGAEMIREIRLRVATVLLWATYYALPDGVRLLFQQILRDGLAAMEALE